MIIALTCIVAIAVIAFVLGVRPKDLPEPEPVSPFQHLDERKAAIYENLRDLQFEYRVGKLSDADYQTTKQDLQKELAAVLAEVDKLSAALGATAAAKPSPAAAKSARAATVRERPTFACPTCNATFDKDLKFCGECGKPMKVAQ
jgi:rRNA maturation endonuclease Nob1